MSKFFQTIENTLTLVGYSVKFASRHKQLLVIPLMRLVAIILAGVVAWFIGRGLIYLFKGPEGLNIVDKNAMSASDHMLILICLFIFMLFVSIIAMLSELMLAHAIGDLFRKNQVSLSDALVKSFRRFGRTVIWATTDVLIHLIANRDKRHSILGDLFVLGWQLATLFIVPVFAFEDLGVYASIKRSAGIFENHYGKTAVAAFSFGSLSLLGALVPFVLLPGAIYLNIIPIFFALCFLYILVAIAFISLAHAIFTTALYFHAVGESTGEIDARVLEQNFIKRE